MLTEKFENLYTDFQNDPLTRKKYIFYIVSTISFIILISLMLYLSTLSSNTTENTQLNIDTSKENTLNSTQLLSTKLYPYQGKITVSASGIVGLTESGKLIFNSIEEYPGLEQYNGSGKYLIKEIQVLEDSSSAIINTTDQKVYLFQKNKLSVYPDNILSLRQIIDKNGKAQYYLIRKISSGYTLELASDLTLNKLPSVLATFSKLGSYSQIIAIKSQPYIFTWLNKALEIKTLSHEGKNLQTVQYIQGYESSYFIDNKLIYNTNIKGVNRLNLIDFNVLDGGKQLTTELQKKVEELGLKGVVYAKRCTLTNKYQIVCLTKAEDASIYDFKKEDKIIKYNYITNEASILMPELGRFAAHDIFIDQNGDVYILEGSSNTIWNLKE